MSRDLLNLVQQDDQFIVEEQQLEEARKHTELLTTIKEQTKPAPLNNWMTVLKLDLTKTHDSYEIWKWYEGHPLVNSIVIPSQEIDFEYEIEPGKRISTDAGLIMDVTGHEVKLLRISNSDTTDDTMDVILSGVDPTKVPA